MKRDWFQAAAAVLLLVQSAYAETLYVNAREGSDSNAGTEAEPLLTIARAAELVNKATESGPTTIKIAPGVYEMAETAVFENERPYTAENRLVIEAAITPDAEDWSPSLMPVILSCQDPRGDADLCKHTETYSLKIKVSHVTVRGVKFLGNPLLNNWHCCVERVGKSLKDLVVTQCMFAGDRDTLDIYCPVIANGDGLVVDHCIFSNCHASAVFWDGTEKKPGKANAMRHCIVEGGYISGVWTCQTAEDFEFHHNIIIDCEYFWVRKRTPRPEKYRLSDCIVSGNRYYSGYAVESGATGQTGPEVSFEETNVTKQAKVVLERDKKARNYMHVVEGTLGSDLGAGLFKK